MADTTGVLVTIAVVTILVASGFLIAVVYALGRRRRGIEIGGRLSAFLTIFGGLVIGTFLLTGADDILVAGPLLAAPLILGANLWRRRQRVQTGQLILGVALPWLLLYSGYLVWSFLDPAGLDRGFVLLWFGVGAIGALVGLVLIVRGDPPPPDANSAASAGEPGSRSYGNIALAIRDPGRVGPFGTSELAALFAFVGTWLIVPVVLGVLGVPVFLAYIASIVLGAVAATEAYIRSMPVRSRRAFEAFSWLGEWELRRAAEVSPGPVPTTPDGATDWLDRNPETDENRWMRVEVLLLAGRFDEAREVVDRLPDTTPVEHWTKVQARDDVDWRSGGPGDLDALRTAASGILPADGDDRLRADVSIAAAEVRRRMADGRSTPGDAVEPLIDVRKRLGKRADGQVGRALRRRLLTTTLAISAVIGALLWLVDPLSARLV
jgi:hypothetical protein